MTGEILSSSSDERRKRITDADLKIIETHMLRVGIKPKNGPALNLVIKKLGDGRTGTADQEKSFEQTYTFY